MTSVPVDLELRTPEGHPARLGDVLNQPLTIVQLVRYFGCLPCQEWAVQLDSHRVELAARGVGTLIVGGSADYQAVFLREEKGVGSPMLLDPDAVFRNAVGAGKNLGVRMLSPKGAASYVRAVRSGFGLQKPTQDAFRSPGVVVLDQAGAVVWSHIGERLGDYPAIDELTAAVARLG